jgi:excisionase family DNA binding protein
LQGLLFHASAELRMGVVQQTPMNKKEAAELLGKSTRTVADYAARGRLRVTYVNGKNGQEASFDEADVRRLKGELETPLSRAEMVPPENESLPAPPASQHMLARFVGALEALAQSRQVPMLETADGKKRSSLSLTELSVKPVLRISEAQRLTGIPHAVLKQAIADGRLNAVENTLGHGRRIKRADLDAFIATA